MGLSSFIFFWRSLANRQRVCDFLLVRYSNFGPDLHRFRDIAGFCAHDFTPSPPYFVGVPVGPDCWCWGGPEQVP